MHIYIVYIYSITALQGLYIGLTGFIVWQSGEADGRMKRMTSRQAGRQQGFDPGAQGI